MPVLAGKVLMNDQNIEAHGSLDLHLRQQLQRSGCAAEAPQARDGVGGFATAAQQGAALLPHKGGRMGCT
jgi:hypothetical protein